MDRHLEAIGLAVAYADLALIPQTIRSAYQSGATPAQVRAAIEGGCFIAEVPAAVRAVALEIAHAWAWIARRGPNAQPLTLRSPDAAGPPASGECRAPGGGGA